MALALPHVQRLAFTVCGGLAKGGEKGVGLLLCNENIRLII